MQANNNKAQNQGAVLFGSSISHQQVLLNNSIILIEEMKNQWTNSTISPSPSNVRIFLKENCLLTSYFSAYIKNTQKIFKQSKANILLAFSLCFRLFQAFIFPDTIIRVFLPVHLNQVTYMWQNLLDASQYASASI